MEAHQQRVVVERNELADKLTKLNSFIGSEIFNSLSGEERIRLAWQSHPMKDYLDILNDRINAFTTEDK